jgi:hypothetical protein
MQWECRQTPPHTPPPHTQICTHRSSLHAPHSTTSVHARQASACMHTPSHTLHARQASACMHTRSHTLLHTVSRCAPSVVHACALSSAQEQHAHDSLGSSGRHGQAAVWQLETVHSHPGGRNGGGTEFMKAALHGASNAVMRHLHSRNVCSAESAPSTGTLRTDHDTTLAGATSRAISFSQLQSCKDRSCMAGFL